MKKQKRSKTTEELLEQAKTKVENLIEKQ